MSEENEAIVRRFYEQLDEGNLAIIDQLVAADFIAHYPGGQDIHGPEGLKQFAGPFYAAFPDLQHTIEDIVGEGDKIVGRFTIRATHKGEFMGIAPTNQKVTLTETAVFRIADGKLAEDWVNYDALGLLQQLGAIPELGQAKQAAAAPTQAEEAIRQLRRNYMVAQDAGDVDGCLSFWIDDGILLPPNEPAVVGKDALRGWYEKNFDQFKFDFTISFDEIAVAGAWAFARGAYAGTVIPKGGGEPIQENGKYLEIHSRQADGSWKFARHIWNSDNPLPGAGD